VNQENKQTETPLQVTDADTRKSPTKGNITILVVDDEEMIRSLLERILEREGYRVVTAVDGVAALETLKLEKIDIVLSDMKMPRMNGFELLKAVKRDYPDKAVIIMTAYGDTYTVKDALLLGADEYVTKPFKSYEISLIIERAYWRLVAAADQGH
jgi:DNA-binding NtrC family response regulator